MEIQRRKRILFRANVGFCPANEMERRDAGSAGDAEPDKMVAPLPSAASDAWRSISCIVNLIYDARRINPDVVVGVDWRQLSVPRPSGDWADAVRKGRAATLTALSCARQRERNKMKHIFLPPAAAA